MKTNLTKTYPFTADHYGYILVTSADGTVTTRQYDVTPEQVNLSLSVNLLGELVVESTTKMQINSYLKNVRDINGEEIYTAGEWEIIQTAPILNPLGVKEGYKYRAVIIAGEV